MTEQQREAIKALEYLENESLSSDRELDGFKINEAVQTIRAALSHAEGEAVEPIGYLTLQAVARLQGDDRLNGEHLYAFDPDDMSKFRGVYLHPAPQVACQTCGGSGLLGERPTHQNPDDAHCEPCPDCSDAAPQVAVPEAVKERVVEAIAEALGDAKDCIRVWTAWGVGTMGPDDFLDVAGDPDRLDEIAEAAITAMLAAAPTAPAGEPAEIPEIGSQWRHRNGNVYTVEAIANGSTERPGQYPVTVVYRGENGKLWSRPAHDWHRSMTLESAPEQPVSDPDGLTEPGRREAEQAYINCAFDYARDPIGSRDWVLFWNGWRARNSAPAPDEREIAAKALDDFMFDVAERVRLLSDSDQEARVLRKVNGWLYSRAKRLRAGKEGE